MWQIECSIPVHHGHTLEMLETYMSSLSTGCTYWITYEYAHADGYMNGVNSSKSSKSSASCYHSNHLWYIVSMDVDPVHYHALLGHLKKLPHVHVDTCINMDTHSVDYISRRYEKNHSYSRYKAYIHKKQHMP